jgi:hypothetical protein
MQSVEVFEKEDAKLEAFISRDINKKDSKWFFKTVKLTESLKYNIEYNKELLKHTIIVKDCTLTDNGEYTINVRNDKFTVNLLVKGMISNFMNKIFLIKNYG